MVKKVLLYDYTDYYLNFLLFSLFKCFFCCSKFHQFWQLGLLQKKCKIYIFAILFLYIHFILCILKPHI